jgi:16S rRNA (uracil1498-N3)-methyltransferase
LAEGHDAPPREAPGDGVSSPAADGVARRGASAAQVFVEDPSSPVVADDDVHHLHRVLRLRAGEAVTVSDGRGRWAIAEYAGGGGPTSTLRAVGPVTLEARPAPSIGVAFVPVKGDRPEWVVQKLTELGVDQIWPLASARSVVRWEGDRSGRALVRLERVAREAAAQSRRVWLPEIHEVQALARWAASAEGGGAAMAEPGGGPVSLGRPTIAVGPEGGWSEAELDLGLPAVGLGPQVLRAETAAVTAGVLLAALRHGVVSPAALGGPTGGLGGPAGMGDSR